MGSSLPTPASSQRASPPLLEDALQVETTALADTNDGYARLNDVLSNTSQKQSEDAPEPGANPPRALKRLKGKEKDLAIASKKKRPLQLLDLPVDILKDIIKEVGCGSASLNRGWLTGRLSSHIPMI